MIADAIEGQIRAGTYAPGDKIPNHHELARLHRTSVITIGGVVVELQARGLVTSEPNRGTYVVDVLPAPGVRPPSHEERLAALEARMDAVEGRLP